MGTLSVWKFDTAEGAGQAVGTLEDLASDDREWMGEIVLVLGPFEPESRHHAVDEDSIDARIDEELAAGGHAKTIAERLAAWSGRPRREIYERVVRRKTGG